MHRVIHGRKLALHTINGQTDRFAIGDCEG